MECQELAPVLSRVGFALQYRKDRLSSPLHRAATVSSHSDAQDLRVKTGRVWLAHYDNEWCCSVTRNPQVAYLSSPKHFLVKNGQNRFGKRCFLKFQAIIAHEMTGFPRKCFTISFRYWEQDSNLLDSNVVLEKPHLSHFEDAAMKHTYLDERS